MTTTKAARKNAFVGHARVILAEAYEALARLSDDRTPMTPTHKAAAEQLRREILNYGGAAYIERIEREHKGTDQ